MATLTFNVAPARRLSAAGGSCVIIGRLVATVMEELVPVTPETVALIVALPVLTAVITPLPFTVRMLGLLLIQLVA